MKLIITTLVFGVLAMGSIPGAEAARSGGKKAAYAAAKKKCLDSDPELAGKQLQACIKKKLKKKKAH